jgi:AcrR family transcriptional regulator
MGRPRAHTSETRTALLDAAEELVNAAGPDAVSVRAVADGVGTTTRAVYSLFGSKEGLIAALAQRAFELLAIGIEQLPQTDDPEHDLVDAAVLVFRKMVLDHPSLFRLAFLHREVERPEPTIAAAQRGLTMLIDRVARLEAKDGLGGRSVQAATCQFDALCEGLAVVELRAPQLFTADPERVWREAVSALVAGFKFEAHV